MDILLAELIIAHHFLYVDTFRRVNLEPSCFPEAIVIGCPPLIETGQIDSSVQDLFYWFSGQKNRRHVVVRATECLAQGIFEVKVGLFHEP